MQAQNYELLRFSSDTESTLGALHKIVDGNPAFMCFVLEDEHREVKVPGETRIPAGRYRIKPRYGSPAFGYLDKRYPWHNGMLWLQDVPNFTYIYIHAGNNDDHTDGCLLVGDKAQQNVTKRGLVQKSADAYQRIYQDMKEHLDAGDEVWLTIKDYA